MKLMKWSYALLGTLPHFSELVGKRTSAIRHKKNEIGKKITKNHSELDAALLGQYTQNDNLNYLMYHAYGMNRPQTQFKSCVGVSGWNSNYTNVMNQTTVPYSSEGQKNNNELRIRRILNDTATAQCTHLHHQQWHTLYHRLKWFVAVDQ